MVAVLSTFCAEGRVGQSAYRAAAVRGVLLVSASTHIDHAQSQDPQMSPEPPSASSRLEGLDRPSPFSSLRSPTHNTTAHGHHRRAQHRRSPGVKQRQRQWRDQRQRREQRQRRQRGQSPRWAQCPLGLRSRILHQHDVAPAACPSSSSSTSARPTRVRAHLRVGYIRGDARERGLPVRVRPLWRGPSIPPAVLLRRAPARVPLPCSVA